MIKIKYEASNYFGPKIRKVKIIDEDKRFVCLEDGDWRLMKFDGRKYCNTFEKAKQFLVVYYTKQIDYHNRCLKTAENYLDEADNLEDR